MFSSAHVCIRLKDCTAYGDNRVVTYPLGTAVKEKEEVVHKVQHLRTGGKLTLCVDFLNGLDECLIVGKECLGQAYPDTQLFKHAIMAD